LKKLKDFDENRNTSFTQFCDFSATRLFAGSDEAAFAARQSVCLAPANLACFQALVYLCALSRDVYIVLPPLGQGRLICLLWLRIGRISSW